VPEPWFDIIDVSPSPISIYEGETPEVTVTVENKGSADGQCLIEFYLEELEKSIAAAGVWIPAGERRSPTFRLAYLSTLSPGTYHLLVRAYKAEVPAPTAILHDTMRVTVYVKEKGVAPPPTTPGLGSAIGAITPILIISSIIIINEVGRRALL